MATYKVIQDIEAEDKFLGPLTLKQFIFAAITAICAYVAFFLFTKKLWYVALVLVPFVMSFGFLAFPWGRDQPTEVWLAAKLRFMFKPRKRVWDQDGIEELVTITAPKIENPYTSNELSETEVRSRLQALSTTLDSRGWAIKNAALNMYTQPAYASSAYQQQTDRLLDPAAVAPAVPAVDVGAADDIMDAQSNPTAQKLDSMINAAAKQHRAAAIERVEQAREASTTPPGKTEPTPAPNYWFMNTPPPPPADLVTFTTHVSEPPPPSPFAAEPASADEQALLAKVRKDKQDTLTGYAHMKVIDPLGIKPPQAKSTNGMTGGSVPDKIRLARNNDRSVASLEREANQKHKTKRQSTDEIVVSLH